VNPETRARLLKLVPLLYVGGMISYFMTRYGGVFSVVDIVVFGRAASGIVSSGSLFEGILYQSGVGYPTVVATLSMLTGLPVATLQTYVLPFGLLFTVGAAVVLFGTVFDGPMAAFGSVLLFLHPFVLFSGYRSTHEKFTYMFIILTVFAVYRILSSESGTTRVRYVLVGYATVLGVVAYNVFFAVIFVGALGLSFVGAQALVFADHKRSRTRQLGYTMAVSFSLLFVYGAFVYPPASQLFANVGSAVVEGVVGTVGGSSAASGGQSYQSALSDWGRFEVWVLLTSYYWIVLPVAGLTWLVRTKSLLSASRNVRSIGPDVFIYALFAALSLELFVGAFVDRFGVSPGGNTQIRILPLVGILAAVLATMGVAGLRRRLRGEGPGLLSRRQRAVVGRTFVVTLLLVTVVFTGAGLLKASSSPLVSENWVFTTGPEQAAMEWIEGEASEQIVWTGYNERVTAGHSIRHPESPTANNHEILGVDIGINYLLSSRTISALAREAGLPLPPHDDAHKVYTNGDARLYWFEEFRPMIDYNRALSGR